jgi:hypothetical protein
MTVTLDTGAIVDLTGNGSTTMSGSYIVGTGHSSSDLTISSLDSSSVTDLA